MSDMAQGINWIDIIFIILLLGMIYKGTRTGVGGQIVSLIGWFCLTFVSIGYYSFMSEALFGFLLQKWAKPLSFFVIAVLIFVVMKFIERIFNILHGEELAAIERVGGAIIAGLRACMLFGVLGILFLLIPVEYMNTAASEGSKTCMFFVRMDVRIYTLIADLANPPQEGQKRDVLNEILTHAKS